ncbi:hypothetical protein ACHAWO_002444 [Cyclotella atomus]|uniref:Uncharacterized protein n=1 Tax=Cyclotella atomus TaxID=382360 RepID=A0ABD3QPB7_9STRA
MKDLFLMVCQFMRKQGHSPILKSMVIMLRTVLILLDEPEEALGHYDDVWKNIQEHRIPPRQAMTLYFQDLYIAVMLRRENIRGICEQFIAAKSMDSSTIMFSDLVKEFIVGLASFQIYRENLQQNQQQLQLWMERGRKCLEQMNVWAEPGAMINFGHKILLLQAEKSYCRGDIVAAKESYKNAVAAAECNAFINDAALAYELAGRFYEEIGDFFLIGMSTIIPGVSNPRQMLFFYLMSTCAKVKTANELHLKVQP